MFSTLALVTLLALTDPPGDAVGQGDLSSPSATLMRDRDAYDILNVSVPEGPNFGLSVGLGRSPTRLPQAILEFYLSDTQNEAGSRTLLPGSGMRLPEGQKWLYAVRIIGDSVQLFEGRSGGAVQVTKKASAALSVSGTTLHLTTHLPLPRHFSLYGISGSYDPFSQTGWRQLREVASPWGYAGSQSYPVLDVVTDRPALQTQALAGGVLPEIRASFSESGWLFLSGAGVVLALGGLVARFALGQREPAPPTPDSLDASLAHTLTLETPLAPFDAQTRLDALNAFGRGEARLVADASALPADREPVVG